MKRWIVIASVAWLITGLSVFLPRRAYVWLTMPLAAVATFVSGVVLIKIVERSNRSG